MIILHAEREAAEPQALGTFANLDAAYDYCVAQEEANGWGWLEGYEIVATDQETGEQFHLVGDMWEAI